MERVKYYTAFTKCLKETSIDKEEYFLLRDKLLTSKQFTVSIS